MISFVGSGTVIATGASGATYNFSSLRDEAGSAPTILEGDTVFLIIGKGHNGVSSIPTPTDYTSSGSNIMSANDTNDVAQQLYYKRMGATPDTSADIPAPGAGSTFAVELVVLRGVDATTVMDVARVGLGFTNGGAPNPGAITPVTAGAWLILTAATSGASAVGVGTLSAPASGVSTATNHFRTETNTGDTQYVSSAVALKTDWASGAFDCPAFGNSNSNAANCSVAGAFAIRPAATAESSGAAAGSATVSGAGRSQGTASGAATGAASASAQGGATGAGAGSSAGLASVSGIALAAAAATGTAAGAASVLGAGASLRESAGSAEGAASAAAAGGSLRAASGSADGLATVAGAGGGQSEASGAASGSATASGFGAASATADGTSAGAATAAGEGQASEAGVATGSATGSAAASGSGGARFEASGSAPSAAAAAGAGQVYATGVAISAGFGVAVGDGRSIAAANGMAAGGSAAAGAGATGGPLPHVPAVRSAEVERQARVAVAAPEHRSAATARASRRQRVQRAGR